MYVLQLMVKLVKRKLSSQLLNFRLQSMKKTSYPPCNKMSAFYSQVVITDFGLFSLIKLCPHRNEMMIPKGWLSYLAPEVLRSLNADKQVGFPDVFSCEKQLYKRLCSSVRRSVTRFSKTANSSKFK